MRLCGRALRLPSDLDTDVIIAGRYLRTKDRSVWAARAFEDLDPTLATRLAGAVLVAGPNFGCGSSREQAAIALREAGVVAVVAPSFARIFYRNAINLGLPIAEAALDCEDGEMVEVDLEAGLVRAGDRPPVPIAPLSSRMRAILGAGGLVEPAEGHCMIPECREVGVVNGRPCGDAVYFLTRYLLRPVGDSFDLLAVEPDPGSTGLMRPVVAERLIANAGDVAVHPTGSAPRPRPARRARPRNRAAVHGLHGARRARDLRARPGKGTSPRGPRLRYRAAPPEPLAGIREMEALGLFGDLGIGFCHHVRDIRETGAAVYPCRAAGFPRSLDADPVEAGATVACCTTGRELVEECHGVPFTQVDTCPLGQVDAEPFIARCCRSEQQGLREVGGLFGTVVHWGDSPAQNLRRGPRARRGLEGA